MDQDQNQTVDDSVVQPKFMDVVRTDNVNPTSKPLQSSQTLMRNTVNRQALSSMPITTSSPIASPDDPVVTPKTSVDSVDDSRLARANNTAKSDMVNRFGTPAAGTPMPVQTDRPVVAPETPKTQEEPMSAANQEPVQPSMELFNKSLASATAHELPRISPKKGGKKLVTGLSAVLILIIGLGLFVNLNINRLDVYLAASKAGFSATLPSKGPSGFSLAKVSSAAGIIATQYSSNSDSRNYTITERQSLWSNQTLLDSYVIPETSGSYQVYNYKGLTIYIYGSKDATWVHGGIWYIIASNNSLSNAQLINMATSM